MVRIDNVPRLITRATIAAYFSVDRRRHLLRNLRPVAIVRMGDKDVELFDSTLLSALSVNAASHPIEQSQPTL